MHSFRGWAGAVVALALLAGGCGDGSGDGAPTDAGGSESGRGGALGFALARDPGQLDPLLAPAEGQIVSRQIYEPLVDRLSPPLGEGLSRRGLAIGWDASRDRQVWLFHLRRRVRFQDGRPFNAAAVAVNATRWKSSPAGRRSLPGLRTVDVPRPTVVRFVFARAVPSLPNLLASPRLGIVSPGALRPASGEKAAIVRHTGAGTGPFELREWRRGRSLTLARSAGWWGTRQGLGPALDQVEFRVEPSERERIGLLGIGEVQVADSLGRGPARQVRLDPMLATIQGRDGRLVGIERSVRGLIGTAAESFSQVWLTRVAG